jgi:hypothetical protein
MSELYPIHSFPRQVGILMESDGMLLRQQS